MIATHYLDGTPTRVGDKIKIPYGDLSWLEGEVMDAALLARDYPHTNTDSKSYVPVWSDYNDGIGRRVDGFVLDEVVIVKLVDDITAWNLVTVGDQIVVTKEDEKHAFTVQDFYDDPAHGRVLQSRYHSYAENDGWVIGR